MQRVRTIKRVGLIGLLAASLLLCSARTFEPVPKLYRAKPEDVPPWAEQGNFRFIRLDGGRIESWKAERTWWGHKFSAEEKDVLTHIYDRDFEKMLGLLKQAEFNWIWVTWSSGWSLKDEDQNRQNLKKVIARCHENGIHVSAYLSASNMFRKSAYRDDPETKKYGLWMHGIPMFYAGPTKTELHISWDRRLADARKPGWRAYLLNKAELAVDVGVDAIIWDNMIGYKDGLAQLLDDTQRMAERKARETGIAPDGTPCKSDSQGLLRRYPVTASDSEFHLIGKETERGWEQAEDISTLLPSLRRYERSTGAVNESLRELLQKRSLNALQRETGMSRHTILRARQGKKIYPRSLQLLKDAVTTSPARNLNGVTK